MHSCEGTGLRCTATRRRCSCRMGLRPTSFLSHSLGPEELYPRPVLSSVAALLLSCFCFLLPQRHWLSSCGMCALGEKSHLSLSGDVLYTAGQLSPPAAPAVRAANLEKMHNMHIANSHSSLLSCAPDTQAQPSKLLCLLALKRQVPSCSWLPCNERQEQRQKARGHRLWFLLQK